MESLVTGMAQWKSLIDISKIAALVKGARFASGSGKTPFAELFVCQLVDGVAHCVHIRRGQSPKEAHSKTITSVSEAQQALSGLDKRCPIIAILPKSFYLTKTLEIPKVPLRQVPVMLGLEVEAILSREFGPAEVSYRLLTPEGDNRNRYEVYISRQKVLKNHLNSLADLGLRPDFIIPSAFMWQRVLANSRQVDLFVTFSSATGQIETASSGPDGQMFIRSFPVSDDSLWPSSKRDIVECIRSVFMQSQSKPDSSPLTVGWIGENCPSFSVNGRVVFRDITQRFVPEQNQKGNKQDPEPLVCITASSLLNGDDAESLRAANLLPRQIMLQHSQRSIHKNLIIGATLVVLGLILVCIALKIAIKRYGTRNTDLSQKIALIRTSGEAAGRKITQLKAIQAALMTKNDFYNVVSGLYSATPHGVTYSHVELKDSGEMTLRGQAESVSLPFLLPEKFESSPVFDNIVLQSAGQKTKGSGSITEFRLTCQLRRDNYDD